MRHPWIAVILLAACTGGPGNKDDDVGDGPYCDETPTVVALDESTELGFAVQEVLTLAVGTHDEVFTWVRDASTSDLALVVTHSGGEARFVDSEAVYPDDGTTIDIGVICDDRVEVDVSVAFDTADGAFAEAWDLALTAVSADTASLYHPLDPDALGGSYDMDVDITEPQFDERSLWVQGTFDAAGSHGDVVGQVSGSDDCEDGDTCSAWASEVGVGGWGATTR